MEAIQELIKTLQDPSVGWLVKVTLFMGTARMLAKPFSAWVQNGFTKALAYVKSTPQSDDDAFVERLLASKFYRIIAFALDWSASVKLPNTDTLKDELKPEVKTP